MGETFSPRTAEAFGFRARGARRPPGAEEGVAAARRPMWGRSSSPTRKDTQCRSRFAVARSGRPIRGRAEYSQDRARSGRKMGAQRASRVLARHSEALPQEPAHRRGQAQERPPAGVRLLGARGCDAEVVKPVHANPPPTLAQIHRQRAAGFDDLLVQACVPRTELLDRCAHCRHCLDAELECFECHCAFKLKQPAMAPAPAPLPHPLAPALERFVPPTRCRLVPPLGTNRRRRIALLDRTKQSTPRSGTSLARWGKESGRGSKPGYTRP